jgi:hypothetical protein
MTFGHGLPHRVTSTEGYLMPIQKDQPPPDPKLFQKYFGPKK